MKLSRSRKPFLHHFAEVYDCPDGEVALGHDLIEGKDAVVAVCEEAAAEMSASPAWSSPLRLGGRCTGGACRCARHTDADGVVRSCPPPTCTSGESVLRDDHVVHRRARGPAVVIAREWRGRVRAERARSTPPTCGPPAWGSTSAPPGAPRLVPAVTPETDRRGGRLHVGSRSTTYAASQATDENEMVLNPEDREFRSTSRRYGTTTSTARADAPRRWSRASARDSAACRE